MVTLGTWSIANIAWGTTGVLSTNDGVAKEFHTMNILWNSINLAIAVPAYFGAKKGKYELPFRQTYKEQQKAEKSFLINSGLDLVYITGGLYLTERSKTINHDRNLGFGQSLMLQGGFLLLLDATLYTVNVRHANKKLNGFLDKVIIGSNGVGYIHRF